MLDVSKESKFHFNDFKEIYNFLEKVGGTGGIENDESTQLLSKHLSVSWNSFEYGFIKKIFQSFGESAVSTLKVKETVSKLNDEPGLQLTNRRFRRGDKNNG